MVIRLWVVIIGISLAMPAGAKPVERMTPYRCQPTPSIEITPIEEGDARPTNNLRRKIGSPITVSPFLSYLNLLYTTYHRMFFRICPLIMQRSHLQIHLPPYVPYPINGQPLQ